MDKRIGVFLAVWALVATLAAVWMAGRLSVATQAQRPPAPASQSSALSVTAAPVAQATPTPPKPPEHHYPDYVSTVPQAFRGSWDEIISDRCEGREARFSFGDRTFANFEQQWEVTKVKLYSPDEMDLYTTMKDEDGKQIDTVWAFKLVDGGRTLTGRKKGGSFFKRCP